MMTKHQIWISGFIAGMILSGCATDSAAPALAVAPQSALQPLAPDDTRVPILDISLVDMVPQARRQFAPKVPAEFRARVSQAEALIDFIVDENGMTRNVFAIHATHVAFGQAAAEAVAKWQFSPGRKDGRPVRTHLQVPMIFSTNEN